MKYNPDIHHRRTIRLADYDYSSAGVYFVTICVRGRECLLGDVADGEMNLNKAGHMVREWWLKLPGKFVGVALDEYTVMPNHFHGIIVINDVGATQCGRPDVDVPNNAGQPHGAAPTLGNAIDWFKTMSTNAYIHGVKHFGWPSFPGRFWQRNYYERVIRNEKEFDQIREYIRNNPRQWEMDEVNPANNP